MTLRLCQKDDYLWQRQGSSASQIHHLAEYYKEHSPLDDRLEFGKNLERISANAKAIIYTLTHKKNPVDLHGKIISNLDIKNELIILIDDLNSIVKKMESAFQMLVSKGAFATTLRRDYVINRSDYQKYQAFRGEGREKCENIKLLAKQMDELFPIIEAGIEQDDRIGRMELRTNLEYFIPVAVIQLMQSYI